MVGVFHYFNVLQIATVRLFHALIRRFGYNPPPMHPLRDRKISPKPDYWRRILFAIFALLAYWRLAAPAGETSIGSLPAAYAWQSFSINDPDKAQAGRSRK